MQQRQHPPRSRSPPANKRTAAVTVIPANGDLCITRHSRESGNPLLLAFCHREHRVGAQHAAPLVAPAFHFAYSCEGSEATRRLPGRSRESHMKLDIDHLMKGLSQQRPIFHSEADFQHALAWRIHETMPDCQVRLEHPFPHEEKRMHLDIWLPTEGVAIELKYRTREIKMDCEGIAFVLKEQAAQDHARYDFLKDVQRLEYVMRAGEKAGFAILLTNDPTYWDPKRMKKRSPNDADFRIHECRKPTGKLAWSDKASPGTIKSREDPIHLSGCYKMHWKDYSDCAAENYGKFRYLAVSVQ